MVAYKTVGNCRGLWKHSISRLGVGHTRIYICRNSSINNYILLFLCIPLYVNFTFKEISFFKKRQGSISNLLFISWMTLRKLLNLSEAAYLYVSSVTSNSLLPQGLWPTRLVCPWDFPVKNTGTGCHFLLQGIFLTQGSNPCLLCLLNWQADSLPPSHGEAHLWV